LLPPPLVAEPDPARLLDELVPTGVEEGSVVGGEEALLGACIVLLL
jgi:hypothetical protein